MDIQPQATRSISDDQELAKVLAGVSQQAARTALDVLASRGILRNATPGDRAQPGRPRHWWVASELLDLLAR